MILRITVEHLLPAVMEWLGDASEDRDREEEPVRIDLLKVISKVDGYEMSKDLERHYGWIPDSELVEILEGAYSLRSQAHRRAEKAWVQENGIVPRFGIGDWVECQSRDDAKVLLRGQITRLDNETGRYLVMIPSLGHVPDGRLGTNGFVLEWEKVEEGNLAPSNGAIQGAQ
jgi:hypothetical protein